MLWISKNFANVCMGRRCSGVTRLPASGFGIVERRARSWKGRERFGILFVVSYGRRGTLRWSQRWKAVGETEGYWPNQISFCKPTISNPYLVECFSVWIEKMSSKPPITVQRAGCSQKKYEHLALHGLKRKISEKIGPVSALCATVEM